MEELKYFFSYARTDSDFVLQLAKELRAVGANLWLDQLDIRGGQHWDSTIEQAMKSCGGMMAVLSPDAVASKNVMDEVSYALEKGKLVVPILVRSCDIPYRLLRVQYIDFTVGHDRGFSELLRTLGLERRVQPTSTVDDQERARTRRRRRRAKELAAICLAVLIVVIAMVVWLKRPQPKTHSLSVTAVDGSVTKRPDRASYNHGETVTLEATPKTGYSFTNWAGDLSDSINPATLVMDANKSVTASFGLKAEGLLTNAIGMKLVFVPPGSFMMGSGDSPAQLTKEAKRDAFGAEFPQHQVHISKGFWMGQTEVTQGQYRSVMNAAPWSGKQYVQEDANNPAVYLNWDDAVEFCRKLSQQEGKTYRLPTEAEWEYACRAGTTTRFYTGDKEEDLERAGWYEANAEGQPYAVGRKEPNKFGLYDMHGNVWEWVEDDLHGTYSKAPNDGRAWVDSPKRASGRVLRGGAWSYDPWDCRSSSRGWRDPVDCLEGLVGFRVVSSGLGSSE